MYNAGVDAHSAFVASGGVKGESGYTFKDTDSAKEALAALDLKLPDLATDRPINVKLKGEEIAVSADRVEGETPDGWATTQRKLSAIYTMPKPPVDEDGGEFDDLVRRVINDDDGIFKDGGYLTKTMEGDWTESSPGGAKGVLMSAGLARRTLRGRWVVSTAAPGAKSTNRSSLHSCQAANGTSGARPFAIGPATWRATPSTGTASSIIAAKAWTTWCSTMNGVTWPGSNPAATIYGGTPLPCSSTPSKNFPMCFSFPKGRKVRARAKARSTVRVDVLFTRGSVECKLALTQDFNLRLAGSVLCYLEEVQLNSGSYTSHQTMAGLAAHQHSADAV